MRKYRLHLVFLSTLLLCFYMLGLIFFLLSLPRQYESFSVEDTDGLAIFTGGSKRIHAALSLIEKGYKKPVFISGVNPKVKKDSLLSHLTASSKNLVTLDYQSRSTKENVINTEAWAKENGLKKIGLITSYYHIPRSLLYWQRAAPNLTISLYPVFPEKMPLDFMFREYHKYILTSLYMI